MQPILFVLRFRSTKVSVVAIKKPRVQERNILHTLLIAYSSSLPLYAGLTFT